MMSPDDQFEIGEPDDVLQLVEEPLDDDELDDCDSKTVQARNSSSVNAFYYPAYYSNHNNNNMNMNNGDDCVAEIEIVDETEGVLDGRMKMANQPQKRRFSDHLTSLLIAPVKFLRAASPLSHDQSNNDDNDYANVTQMFGSTNAYQPSMRKAQYEPILATDDDDDNNDDKANDDENDKTKEEQSKNKAPERVMFGYAAYHGSRWIPPEILDNWEHFVTNQPTAAPRLSVARPTMCYPGFD
ncbi:expressed unknown protein [Seminavis robusta]|uniref:Uncharacterized protein n=1 Tax=Seminavis robusta TaxID=568900 RepID=A0A9N8EUJ8_9STRA|nr:expressed unknown protein [Seminavis robusta]|eukprot:Sro1614_g286090.1 n/a (241) ;mRNA; f:6619-7341